MTEFRMGSPPARPHEGGSAVRAPVVHDEDPHVLREPGRTGCAVAALLAVPPEIAEQLVEGRSETSLLVVCGQDDGEAGGDHRRTIASG